MHGTDADAYGVPRAPGEVDLFVRRRMALETCSCGNLWATQFGRLLELRRKQVTGTLATMWGVCR